MKKIMIKISKKKINWKIIKVNQINKLKEKLRNNIRKNRKKKKNNNKKMNLKKFNQVLIQVAIAVMHQKLSWKEKLRLWNFKKSIGKLSQELIAGLIREKEWEIQRKIKVKQEGKLLHWDLQGKNLLKNQK